VEGISEARKAAFVCKFPNCLKVDLKTNERVEATTRGFTDRHEDVISHYS